jgi:uncharacterized protein (DUF433 family)
MSPLASTSAAKLPGLRELVVRDPDILAGRAVMRGTRVPVDVVFENLADGLTLDEILESYPTLDRADVLALIEHARQTVLTAA